MESIFYDGTKILSLLDINGKTPELYMVTTNRSGGKTTYFGRLLINRFKNKGQKFALLYRYKYELDDAPEKFFKVLQDVFFPDDVMTVKKGASSTGYRKLYLNEIECGYAIALNCKMDEIKKMSHMFSDVETILFDEFQSESNSYLSEEIKNFLSIHKSIARGKGKQVRHVPVIMCANPITILNPYYTALGISTRLRDDTKFMKGDGWVLEQGYVETADKMQQESGISRAFKDEKYIQYSAQGVYLNDNDSFIDKPSGHFRYLATIKFKGKYYSIKEYKNEGIIYCDDSYDSQFPVKISATLSDHSINYVMLSNNRLLIALLKYYFDRGCFRFKNMLCKDVIISILSY